MCGSFFAPIEPLPHFLPRLEVGGCPFWNLDQRASLGITASAGFTDLDRKRSKSAQLDAITARQSRGNFVEYGIDDFLNVPKVEVRVLCPYAPNEIGLNHAKFPLGPDDGRRAGQAATFRVLWQYC